MDVPRPTQVLLVPWLVFTQWKQVREKPTDIWTQLQQPTLKVSVPQTVPG